ncbi:MAG TPA: hypothetical protein GXZ24_04690 [Firmicutes bacterium]|nr:hypothetical protein [Bacillota bacterium]
MKKIKDRVLLGVLVGVFSAIVGRLLNTFEYRAGLTDAKYDNMAANLFVDKRQIGTPEGRTIGAVVNAVLTGVAGISIVYLLSMTGRDKPVLKGMGIGILFWLALFGLTPRVGIVERFKKPLSPLLGLVDHLIFGGLCGWIVSKFGDSTLFPDVGQKNVKRKLPLFSYAKKPGTRGNTIK